MPTVYRWKGWAFLFYSVDGDEPRHIHVKKGHQEAKFWLSDCRLAKVSGIKEHELRQLERVVREKQQDFIKAWNEYFGS